MWCIHCQQDVPALPSGEKQMLCCTRCGGTVSPVRPETDEPTPVFDPWELDEELRDVERVLHEMPIDDGDAETIYRREASRFDFPQIGPLGWHMPMEKDVEEPPAVPRQGGSMLGALMWMALSLGTASFVCGGILLGWSLAAGRQELWTIGLPVALGGQVALLIGLVLQLDRLWHDNRTATAKLDNVGEQLHELKTTTNLLGANQGSASSVFYSHLAGGAGPQLLLNDLKSQLDLLAVKIAKSEG